MRRVVLVKKNNVRREKTRCDECVEDSEELNPRKYAAEYNEGAEMRG